MLEAAGKLFAQHGYDATSVRDICLEAGANIAAVNYHFGDKRSLYRAVIERGASESPSFRPPPAEATPEERLHQLVFAALEDIFETREATLVIAREFLDPPQDMIEVLQGPMKAHFNSVIRLFNELSDGRLDDMELHMAVMGLMAQLQYYRVSHKFIPHVIGDARNEQLTVPLLAEHIPRSTIRSLKR